VLTRAIRVNAPEKTEPGPSRRGPARCYPSIRGALGGRTLSRGGRSRRGRRCRRSAARRLFLLAAAGRCSRGAAARARITARAGAATRSTAAMLEPLAQIETTSTTTTARAGLRLQATHGEADRGNDHDHSIHQSTLHEITLKKQCTGNVIHDFNADAASLLPIIARQVEPPCGNGSV